MLNRISHLIFITLLCTLLFACGGGGGAAPAGDGGSNDDGNATTDVVPTISTFSPVDGAIGVEPAIMLNVSFDKDMFATSIDAGSFTLSDSNDEIVGLVSFDALTNVASFTPEKPLALLGSYTASLSGTITDLSGNALIPASWSFTTRDGVWDSTEPVENDLGNAYSPQIVVDPNGSTLVVWGQNDDIWVNRYTPSEGWGEAELIGADDTASAYNAQIAIDASGNVLAVWEQTDGILYNIWANRYTPSEGWGNAELIETNNAGSAWTPKIAIDANGNALVVWRQDDGIRYNIWANRYTLDNGWGVAELIETNNTGDADYHPQIAINANGNALVVWRQDDGIRYNVWANRYTPDNGWGKAELIGTSDARGVSRPEIIMDANGNALAVWEQDDSNRNDSIWANRYTVGSDSWGEAELIETDDAVDAIMPQIAFDTNGNALAVWVQYDDTGENIWGNKYTAGSGWGMAELIVLNEDESASDPQIAFDANNNALMIWAREGNSPVTSLMASRYTAGASWSAAEVIEINAGTESPKLAVNANGNALAVWRSRIDGYNDIVAIRFE